MCIGPLEKFLEPFEVKRNGATKVGVDENISCQVGHFLFLKPKSGLRARKIFEKTKKINEMCSEAFGYVSDNLVTTQMLFCDSRMIFKKN